MTTIRSFHKIRLFGIAALLLASACASTTPAPASGTSSQTAGDTRANDSQVRATALKGYQAWAHGFATGDFSGYISMLSPEFEFSFPMGPHAGLHTGSEGYQHMVAKANEHQTQGHRLTLEAPSGVFVDGDRVALLFESHGKFGDYQYRANNMIVLGVSGDRITAFREFLGDIDPGFLCASIPAK